MSLVDIAIDRMARGLDGRDPERERRYLQAMLRLPGEAVVIVVPEAMLLGELATDYAEALAASGWHEVVRGRLLGPDEAPVPLAVRKLSKTPGTVEDLDFDGNVAVMASGQLVSTAAYQRYRSRLDDALG